MSSVVKVEFTMNFTPDEKGKVVYQVKFSMPNHPGIPVPDKVKKLSLEQIHDLCATLGSHPDAGLADIPKN